MPIPWHSMQLRAAVAGYSSQTHASDHIEEPSELLRHKSPLQPRGRPASLRSRDDCRSSWVAHRNALLPKFNNVGNAANVEVRWPSAFKKNSSPSPAESSSTARPPGPVTLAASTPLILF